MKRATSSLVLLFAFTASSCQKNESSNTTDTSNKTAPVATATSGLQLDASLASVAQHLDTQGAHFSVTNTSGDMEAICSFIDDIISIIPEGELGFDLDISMQDILKKSGFNHITAIGESSRFDDDHWHNRTFYATDGKREGILSLLGDKASPYASPDFAPANTDLLFETQINLKQLKSISEQIANSLGEEAEQSFAQAMQQKLLGAAMTTGDIFGKFNARISIAAMLDTNKTWQAERNGPQFPVIDLVMRLDGVNWLWDAYGKDIEKNGIIREEGTKKYITFEQAFPTPMGDLHPMIIVDSAANHVWFALQEKTLLSCQDKSPKLAQSKNFQTSIKGLPQEGNTLCFVSQNFCHALMTTPAEIPKQINPEKFTALSKKITSYLTRSKNGYSWALSNQDDGIVIATNAPFSSKNSGVITMATASSVLIPTLFIGASAYKEGADRAACILNIRNIQVAVRSHENLNGLNTGDPLNLTEIFGPDKYMEIRPTCPLGHQYTISKTFPKVGTAAATCEHPEHHPDDTSGW